MSCFCARTMSRIVMTGNDKAQGLPVAGSMSLRPGRPHAAAEHVGADEEIALGVEHLAGPDHGRPPAGLAGDRVRVGGILVAGQRVADQDRVRAFGVERAVGLVGDREGAELDPAIEPQRLADDEPMAGPILVLARRGRAAKSGSTRELLGCAVVAEHPAGCR